MGLFFDSMQGLPGIPPPAPPQQPSDPNSLISQLMGLGSVDMRHKLLQQQIEQGQQTAQGSPIDYTKGKGTPLLLAGLANLVSSGMGGFQQGKAMGGLRSLVGEQTAGRKAGLEMGTQWTPPDIAGVQTAADSDLPGKTQSAQQSVGAGRKLAMALSASGDPSLAAIGKNIMAQSDEAQQSLQSMPQTRVGLQEAMQKMRQGQRSEEAATSPIASGIKQKLGAALGLNIPDEASNADIDSVLSTAEKVQSLKTGARKLDENEINPVTGQPYKKYGPIGSSAGAPGSALTDKRFPKMQADLEADLDPNKSRSGTLRGNQERLNAAQRLLTLAIDPITGGPADLIPNQMSELSGSLATLIGGGSSGEGTRRELTPYTKGRSMAELMQWITDKPHGAGQQAFVQQMIDTAKREQGTAQQAIRQGQTQRLSSHLQYLQMFPDQAKAQLESYGFDPDDVDFKTGKYTPKIPLAPLVNSKGAAAAPKRISGDADYEALPSGSTYIAPDGTTRTKR